MDFQTRNAINDTDTCLFHPFGGTHVVLFVEACFQLYKDSHFLTVLGGTDQSIDHGRVFGNPILRNLDLINLRIEGRFH